MIKLGEMQTLIVGRTVEFGVYLREKIDSKKEDDVLLPIKQVPEGTKPGDFIEVFVYKDSNDRIIATTKRPKLVIGEIGFLKVVEIARIGAFMNWGLEKDLFLPHKEQVGEIRVNGEYMVGIYIDKSDRLCATMNLYNVLKTNSPYSLNDKVTGTVFSLRRGLGAMVAVDGKYLGMIHEKEILKPLNIGDEVEVRINQIKEDGKLGLSLKDAPRLQIDKDGERIYTRLLKNNGFLPYNDNTNPEEIKKAFNISKSSFKKAIGNLMKRKIIVIKKNGIELANSSNNGNSINNGNNRSAGNGGSNRGYGNGRGNGNSNNGRSNDSNRSNGNYRNNENYRGNGSSKGNNNNKNNSRSYDGNKGFRSNENQKNGGSNGSRNNSYRDNNNRDNENKSYKGKDNNKDYRNNFSSDDNKARQKKRNPNINRKYSK